MIKRLKGKENLIKFALFLVAILGIYLIIAWASYSPLDNAWSVASSVTQNVLNKTGSLGAWLIDVLFATLGKTAFLVPFGLASVPIYLLATQTSEELTLRQTLFWASSFLLLNIGLAGLAGVLFAHSSAYLSGGFIGAMLADFVGGTLGVFGTLFISMIFTAIGFYFCSGQIILQLFNRLYEWITENKQKNGEEDPIQAVSSEQHFANLENEETEIDNQLVQFEPASPTENNHFTDISAFPRPNIIGLKKDVPQPEPENLTNVAMFNVQSSVDLPKVSVPELSINEQTVPVLANEPEPDFSSTTQNEPHFPTVRLNPEMPEKMNIVPAVEPMQKVVQNSANIPPLVEPKMALQTQSDDQSAQATIPETTLETALEMPSVKIAGQPEFLNPATQTELPEPIEQAVSSEQNFAKAQTYPKNYGNSLIHPLLQQPTPLEKPTTPLPTLDLLSESSSETQQITEQEIVETSARIEQELANFGVKATVEDVLVGPVVTRYEIKPAPGVKANKITALDSDLARALIFKAIRITDVVPGKPFMGIETPNQHRETVWLRDVLDSQEFRHSKATLPMALGKEINGKPVIVDMAKMPHLLVAGQTGGGKSVGVNTMILSLLFKLSPEQVRFIMIDPKVVELSVYNDIPHLLTPVVTDMKKAENALRWAVEEMERRYLLVSSLNVRNIEGYNAKIEQAEEMGLPIPNTVWRPGDTMDTLPPHLTKMSYIVLIVDEFADLMMSAGKQVEDHIMRIAQKARAVGIHLILATQRPSTDVITGVIKANIPSRIAFTVASQIDSRTILDKGGAESLLGRGDMLYSGAGSPEIIRVHGAFMTDDDVQRVADNWRARGKPEYIDSIIESSDEELDGSSRENGGELDPLFDEVVQYIMDSGSTSISGIQRRFSIGFNRAARVIDQLEDQGILSKPDNRGKREILVK